MYTGNCRPFTTEQSEIGDKLSRHLTFYNTEDVFFMYDLICIPGLYNFEGCMFSVGTRLNIDLGYLIPRTQNSC